MPSVFDSEQAVCWQGVGQVACVGLVGTGLFFRGTAIESRLRFGLRMSLQMQMLFAGGQVEVGHMSFVHGVPLMLLASARISSKGPMCARLSRWLCSTAVHVGGRECTTRNAHINPLDLALKHVSKHALATARRLTHSLAVKLQASVGCPCAPAPRA